MYQKVDDLLAACRLEKTTRPFIKEQLTLTLRVTLSTCIPKAYTEIVALHVDSVLEILILAYSVHFSMLLQV